MVKKGFRGETSPEKMPVVTTGIEMSRRPPTAVDAVKERLTGGNAPADESGAAKLVSDFIRHSD